MNKLKVQLKLKCFFFVCYRTSLVMCSTLTDNQKPKGRNFLFHEGTHTAFIRWNTVNSPSAWMETFCFNTAKSCILQWHQHSIISRVMLSQTAATQHKSHRLWRTTTLAFPLKSNSSNLQTRSHVWSCTLAWWMSDQTNIHQGKVHC